LVSKLTVGNMTSDSWPPRIVVCVGTVVLRDDKVLFIRQAQGQSLAGQWSIPWGVVDPGETPDEAALRETKEEGGVTAVISGLLGYQNFNWENMTALIYLCQHVSGEPQHDGGQETDAAAYFSQAEIDALDEPIEPWCDWLVRRVLQDNYHLIPTEPANPQRPKTAFF
jgi:mutator protein MutT